MEYFFKFKLSFIGTIRKLIRMKIINIEAYFICYKNQKFLLYYKFSQNVFIVI